MISVVEQDEESNVAQNHALATAAFSWEDVEDVAFDVDDDQ